MSRKAKSNRDVKYDDYIGIPVEKETKLEVARVAEVEERNPTDMARVLLKESLAGRRVEIKAAAQAAD